MLTETTARSRDLSAIGVIHLEGAGDGDDTVEIRLVVGGTARRSGRGSMELDLAGSGLVVAAADLIWLVTTNKGWAHMRGEAHVPDVGRLPFRVDLFSAAEARDPGPDRVALRVYALGDDPNRASPTHKLSGWMDAGSVRI